MRSKSLPSDWYRPQTASAVSFPAQHCSPAPAPRGRQTSARGGARAGACWNGDSAGGWRKSETPAAAPSTLKPAQRHLLASISSSTRQRRSVSSTQSSRCVSRSRVTFAAAQQDAASADAPRGWNQYYIKDEPGGPMTRVSAGSSRCLLAVDPSSTPCRHRFHSPQPAAHPGLAGPLPKSLDALLTWRLLQARYWLHPVCSTTPPA